MRGGCGPLGRPGGGRTSRGPLGKRGPRPRTPGPASAGGALSAHGQSHTACFQHTVLFSSVNLHFCSSNFPERPPPPLPRRSRESGEQIRRERETERAAGSRASSGGAGGLGGQTEDASRVNWRDPPGREPRRRQPPEQPDRPAAGWRRQEGLRTRRRAGGAGARVSARAAAAPPKHGACGGGLTPRACRPGAAVGTRGCAFPQAGPQRTRDAGAPFSGTQRPGRRP